MARCLVRKRDGVWLVLDRVMRIRYAAADYRMALTFALMTANTRPKLGQLVIDHKTPWRDGGEIEFLYLSPEEVRKLVRDSFGPDADEWDEP